MTWIVILGPKDSRIPKQMAGSFSSEAEAKTWAAFNTPTDWKSVLADTATDKGFSRPFPTTEGVVVLDMPASRFN